MEVRTSELSQLEERFKKYYDMTHPNGSHCYFDLIQEEYKEFLKETSSTPEDFKELCDLIWVCIMYAIEQGYPVADGLEELSKEYLSKFHDKEGKYNPQFRSDGKLLKGSGFKKADFTKFFK